LSNENKKIKDANLKCWMQTSPNFRSFLNISDTLYSYQAECSSCSNNKIQMSLKSSSLHELLTYAYNIQSGIYFSPLLIDVFPLQ